MKISVIGVGVVGNAVYQSCLKRNVNIIAYDKYKAIGTMADILPTEIVFLCLPTPYDVVVGQYDKSALYEVVQSLSENSYSGLVVLKSTVEPETSETLSTKYPTLNICHNPEFLSAKTAERDFDNQAHIVIGHTQRCPDYLVAKLANFYKCYFPGAKISECSSGESELMKLGVNNFYAVKVQFFTELYCLANTIPNVDYNIVREMMVKNGWINPMHTVIPGSDGNISYGGMCFPKDTNALYQYMKRKDSARQVIGATITERDDMRDD